MSGSSPDGPSHGVAHVVVAAFLILKALIVVYNIATFPTTRQYDARHHAWRARSAGLEVDRMAYNSPLYYLPGLLWVDASDYFEDGKPAKPPRGTARHDYETLEKIQWFNSVYVMGALLIWIYGILPLLASSRRSWFLASMALIAMPGFPKIAVMAHPDVLLLFLAALTFFLTIRWLPSRPHFGRNLLLALLAGLTGACRPFAVVPMLLCWALNLGMMVRDTRAELRAGANQGPKIASLVVRAAAVSLIVVSLSGAWWVYRYEQSGTVMDAYNHKYVDPYQPLKEDFDYGHYYTSFYFGKLLQVPSRADVPIGPGTNPKGNSFWTQLYSDFWGDHFLYFSGTKQGAERKLWAKRVLFVLALPLSLLLWLGIVTGTFRAAVEAARRRAALSPWLFMAAIFWGGFLIFVAWQGTAGLLPGKNSSIKFLYIAWAVPFGVGTAAAQPIPARAFAPIAVLELLVAFAALPVSLNWP
jgi:hypothetical protein